MDTLVQDQLSRAIASAGEGKRFILIKSLVGFSSCTSVQIGGRDSGTSFGLVPILQTKPPH